MTLRAAKAVCLWALCSPAWAQGSLSPLTQADYLGMRKTSGPAVLMLAACGPRARVGALEALERSGVRATVFVSVKAIEGSPELVQILKRRPDLFEVGSLGQNCASRDRSLGAVYADALANKPESKERVAAMAALGESLLAGSKAIEKALGRSARFYAFGDDFDNSAADPFEISRMSAGLAAYLKAPTPRSRYDALAVAKAGFGARVVMAKLDGAGPLSGQGSHGAAAVEGALRAAGAPKLSRKASEAWIKNKRAALSREIEGR